MKGHKRAATDWHRSRGAGHQIMISTAMVWVFMAYGPDNRDLIGDLGQIRDHFAEVNARNGGRNGFVLSPDLRWSVRLGIKCFVVRRPPIHPDQDAVDLVWAGFPG